MLLRHNLCVRLHAHIKNIQENFPRYWPFHRALSTVAQVSRNISSLHIKYELFHFSSPSEISRVSVILCSMNLMCFELEQMFADGKY